MKKLISIGVALALLTMVVVPGAAAAYTTPDTYSKVPFAIIQSGFELVGELLDALGPTLGLPTYLDSTLMNTIGGWAGGPLSWTVDMLAWGLDLGATIYASVDTAFSIGYPVIGTMLSDVACGLMVCWSATNCTGNFTPCPP